MLFKEEYFQHIMVPVKHLMGDLNHKLCVCKLNVHSCCFRVILKYLIGSV